MYLKGCPLGHLSRIFIVKKIRKIRSLGIYILYGFSAPISLTDQQTCLISWADYLSLVLRLDQVDQYMAFPLPLPLGQSSESINLSGRLSFVVFFPKICLLFFWPHSLFNPGLPRNCVFKHFYILFFYLSLVSSGLAVGWNWWSESC